MSKRYLSLKSAVTLAFLAVAAVPVWLAWEWPQGIAIQQERERAKETLRVYTNAVAMALERYNADVVAAFDILADELQAAGPVRHKGLEGTLKTFGFNHICNFEVMTGSLLGGMRREGKPCPKIVPSERFEIIRSISVEGQIRYSSVMISPAGQPMILMVRRSGTMIAVGSLDTTYFRDLAKTISFGGNGHAAILDHMGRVLAHPKSAWVNPPHDMAKYDIDVVLQLLKGESGHGEFTSPAKGDMMYTAYRSVQGPGWGILVNQPAAEIEQAVDKIKGSTFKVLMIALGIAALLAALLAHVLLDPIKRIRMAAERLGNGNGDALIPAKGLASRLTEINDLRAAFNAMVLRIRKSQRTEIASRKEAQEANRIKSRFLANMSHELRTPLNAIIGFADVCKRRLKGPEHERDREYAGYIHDSGHHLLSIINDLLDLSRIEAGARKLEERDVDIGSTIKEACAMLGTMAEDKGIKVVLRGVEDDLMLWADPRAIKQIILNLATNAVRYTQEGGRVVIGCERAETGAITLFIEDNGPGIEPEELEKIRTPFTRGHSQEIAAVPGTGLGLSIVEALADLHGARLDLTSEQDKGTRARVVFPPNRSLLMLDDDAMAGTAAE